MNVDLLIYGILPKYIRWREKNGNYAETRLGDMRKRHPPRERSKQLHPEICESLPEHFPEELLETAYSLEVLHIRGVAWNYEDAIKAIHAFVDAQYAILGGDVYRKEHETLVPTLDSWYLNQQTLTWEEYVEESRKAALSYIEMYYRRNGEMYYYAPVAAEKGWKNVT